MDEANPECLLQQCSESPQYVDLQPYQKIDCARYFVRRILPLLKGDCLVGSSHLAEYGMRALVFVRVNHKAAANAQHKWLMKYRPHFSHRYYVLKSGLGLILFIASR